MDEKELEMFVLLLVSELRREFSVHRLTGRTAQSIHYGIIKENSAFVELDPQFYDVSEYLKTGQIIPAKFGGKKKEITLYENDSSGSYASLLDSVGSMFHHHKGFFLRALKRALDKFAVESGYHMKLTVTDSNGTESVYEERFKRAISRTRHRKKKGSGATKNTAKVKTPKKPKKALGMKK